MALTGALSFYYMSDKLLGWDDIASSTLHKQAAQSSKTLVTVYQNKQHCISKYSNLQWTLVYGLIDIINTFYVRVTLAFILSILWQSTQLHWASKCPLAKQEILHNLQNPKLHYCDHTTCHWSFIMTAMNQVHKLATLFKNHFSIIIPASSRSSK